MLEQLARSWLAVLSQPTVATFDREQPRAALDRVLVGMLLAGLIAGIGTALGRWLLLLLLPAFLSEEERIPLPGDGGQLALTLGGIMIAPVVALAGFFLWSGVLFLAAKALGGPGDFVVHSYVLSLVAAPITAMGGALGVIPCLALIAGFPLFIYQLVLTTLALQSAHSFSVGRAVAVWLIPLVALFLLALCLAVALVALVIALAVSS